MTHNLRHKGYVRELPSREGGDIVRGTTVGFSPTHFGSTIYSDEDIDFFVLYRISSAPMHLVEQVRRGLQFDLSFNGTAIRCFVYDIPFSTSFSTAPPLSTQSLNAPRL
jgi:hypothetical protein